jgi:hypothetical protein
MFRFAPRSKVVIFFRSPSILLSPKLAVNYLPIGILSSASRNDSTGRVAQNIDTVLKAGEGLYTLVRFKIPNLAGSVPGPTYELVLPMLLKGDDATSVALEVADLDTLLCEKPNLRR